MTHSEIESSRFGLNIFREVSEDINIKELRLGILNNRPDILFLRVNSNSKPAQQLLNELNYPFIHADTLVYYELDLLKMPIKALKNNLQFEVFDSSNIALLDNMIETTFAGYKNHYYSNDFLDKKDILKGYVEWAKSYSTGEGKIAWLVKNDTDYVGFTTCSYNIKNNTCEGILYGVMPNHSGGGIYSDLIRFTATHFQKLGFEKMSVSTQINNYAVQKVWTREGFFLTKAYDTYHINCFLGKEKKGWENKNYELYFPYEEVVSFANISGDNNPIHINHNVALANGFNNCIVHGVLVQGKISATLGTDFPGNGTIIVNMNSNFISPILVNTKYSLINYFRHISNSRYKVISEIKDISGKLCFVSHLTVVKK